MTLLVRDERDIIRENIEFHLAQGVDFIVATDNRSVDSTAEILREYEEKGCLHYIFEGDDNYNQHAWVTRMARMAHNDFGADWIINNDADEFWWPLQGDLKSCFEQLPDEINMVKAERFNFVMTGHSDVKFWRRMVHREAISFNSSGRPLPPKVAHRGYPEIIVAQGNHSVSGFERPLAAQDLIEILHFPIRSLAQIENKISKGGAAYENNQELPRSIGITWRELYDRYQSDSGLVAYFEEQFYDDERLEKDLKTGVLNRDLRLRELLGSLSTRF